MPLGEQLGDLSLDVLQIFGLQPLLRDRRGYLLVAIAGAEIHIG
jgi:hypothetical protein